VVASDGRDLLACQMTIDTHTQTNKCTQLKSSSETRVQEFHREFKRERERSTERGRAHSEVEREVERERAITGEGSKQEKRKRARAGRGREWTQESPTKPCVESDPKARWPSAGTACLKIRFGFYRLVFINAVVV
jgi:IS30 family transposase